MGGKRWPQQQNGPRRTQDGWSAYDGQRSGGQPPWRVWSGAYAASPKVAARPHYDAIVLHGDKHKKTIKEELSLVESQDVLLRREVQKALSQARKADARVRRLKEERATREAQWDQYVKDSRDAFRAEKARHEKHLQRIEEEIKGTIEAGKEASTQVQELILNGPQRVEEATQPMGETDDSWDALIGAEPQLEPGFLKDAVMAAQRVQLGGSQPSMPPGAMMTQEAATRLLQLALAGLPQTVHSGPIAMSQPGPVPPVPRQDPLITTAPPGLGHAGGQPAEPSGPPSGDQQIPTHGPQAYDALSPAPANARSTPYPPNPSHQPHLPAEVGQQHAATVPEVRRPAHTKGVPRQDFKLASKSPPKPVTGSMDIQDKLDAKRQAARSAMQPFGGLPSMPPEDTGQMHAPSMPAPPPSGIIDDDLDQAPTGNEQSDLS